MPVLGACFSWDLFDDWNSMHMIFRHQRPFGNKDERLRILTLSDHKQANRILYAGHFLKALHRTWLCDWEKLREGVNLGFLLEISGWFTKLKHLCWHSRGAS